MDVGDGDPEHQRRNGWRKQLEAVSQQYDYCGLQLRQSVGESSHSQTNRFRVRSARLAGESQVDLPVDLDAFGLDFTNGKPELRGQMHARDDHLEPERQVSPDAFQESAE